MGKNIKSYATIPCPLSPGKGGKPYGKSPKILRLNMVRLNHTPYSHLKNLRLNRQNYTKFFNFSKLSQVQVRELRKIRTILLTYSILCFRHLPRQRTLQNSSELRRFRAVRPHSPRITRNSHHLLTLYITFQMPDQWQGTL